VARAKAVVEEEAEIVLINDVDSVEILDPSTMAGGAADFSADESVVGLDEGLAVGESVVGLDEGLARGETVVGLDKGLFEEGLATKPSDLSSEKPVNQPSTKPVRPPFADDSDTADKSTDQPSDLSADKPTNQPFNLSDSFFNDAEKDSDAPVAADLGLGFDEGLAVGELVGFDEGLSVGESVCFDLGIPVGESLGFDHGIAVGEGLAAELSLGFDNGIAVGEGLAVDEDSSSDSSSSSSSDDDSSSLDFYERHKDYCEVCGQPGFLLCCALCNIVSHVHCAGLQEEPPNDWMCPYCLADVMKKKDGKERRKATQACREMERMSRECMKATEDQIKPSSEDSLFVTSPMTAKTLPPTISQCL
jgi:hypothetical protein